MKKLASFFCYSLLLFGVAAPNLSLAGDYEKEIKAARIALDKAAQRLAELHTSEYGKGHGKKAMLGILLGDGPMMGGVEMVGVTPGGGAEQAGLKAGDKIVRIGDTSLAQADNPMNALTSHMKNVSPGETVNVVYLRDDNEIEADITTQARSKHIMKMVTRSVDNFDFDFDLDDIRTGAIAVAGNVLGGTNSNNLKFVEGDLAKYFDVDQGVVFWDVPKDSTLKAGDVLLEVDGEAVDDVPQALVALGDSATQDVEAKVKRRGKTKSLTIAAGSFDKVRMETEIWA